MVLVPLNQPNKLETLTMRNWCIENIGAESPTTWFEIVPVSTGFAQNAEKYYLFLNAGLLSAMIFHTDKDATAFKLVFGL